MPNWCSNSFEVTASKEKIDAFEKFLEVNNGKEWFNYFAPTPKDLEEGGWYEWNVENWGCKWNCDAQDWTREGDTISFWFDSPWSPPTQLYNKIQEEGFVVKAEYLEEGMGFVGEYIDGVEETYEFEDESDLDEIPEHLVENWNLRDRFEDWDDEWNSDDDEEFEEEDEKDGKSNS
jgi:hypothetical protein